MTEIKSEWTPLTPEVLEQLADEGVFWISVIDSKVPVLAIWYDGLREFIPFDKPDQGACFYPNEVTHIMPLVTPEMPA